MNEYNNTSMQGIITAPTTYSCVAVNNVQLWFDHWNFMLPPYFNCSECAIGTSFYQMYQHKRILEHDKKYITTRYGQGHHLELPNEDITSQYWIMIDKNG